MLKWFRTIFSLGASDITLVAIFPYLCFWRHSLCSNFGGIDPGKFNRIEPLSVPTKKAHV